MIIKGSEYQNVKFTDNNSKHVLLSIFTSFITPQIALFKQNKTSNNIPFSKDNFRSDI